MTRRHHFPHQNQPNATEIKSRNKEHPKSDERQKKAKSRTHIFKLLRPPIQTPIRELSLTEPPRQGVNIYDVQPIQNGQRRNAHEGYENETEIKVSQEDMVGLQPILTLARMAFRPHHTPKPAIEIPAPLQIPDRLLLIYLTQPAK